MDFDDHEDREDQEIEAHEPPEDYSVRPQMRSAGGDSGSPAARKSGSGGGGGTYRYRECLKNHAVSMGGHAVDGCGEFMPAGEDGTLNALKCAACNCHRNFHRKESESGRTSTAAAATTTTQYHIQHHHQPQVASYYRSNPMAAGYLHVSPTPHHQQRPLALPSISRDDEDMSNPSSSGGGSGSGSKKRFRTKFSHEQKEKMLLLAEKIGWRFQKSDEAEVEQFCAETGVKRQVLKVWMHNNKHTLGKKP